MKLHLLPFLFLLLLLVLAQCTERQGGQHVQGGTHMEKRSVKKFKKPKSRKKVFRKKSKSSKSELSETVPISLENTEWQYNKAWQGSGTPEAHATKRNNQRTAARTPEEDPRNGWGKWIPSSRRGDLPKNWKIWDDNMTTSRASIGDTPEHWQSYINRQED
ncbi:hypothetical protein E2C01_016499 [Portunus trituberculatus]|uniref:Uncharacterized protein n=1 Tax=Portunus trituberculatus TaxID=210409 RepID=A0A5B7DPJ4_PORTR|nr:hypothetical protein [Portunus trituberculatus]